MSSEWPLKRLGDYCEKIGSGATPRGGKEAYLESGPVRLIRSQNIYNEGFSEPGLAYISHEQAAKLNNVSVHEGDVLLNITGDSVARVCQAPAQYIPARVNQHVAIIRPISSEINPRYLHYFLASPGQQNLLLGLASIGATRSALTKGMIEDLQVLKPPIDVQTNIANILGTLDNRITLLREINATLEAIAQTLFKSWFVDFDPFRAKMEGRTPEGMDEANAALFSDSFESSELGEIPSGWRVGSLGNELKISYGKNLPVTKLLLAGYPVFGGNGQIGFYDKYHFESRQVLISCRGAASGKVNQSCPKAFITNNSLVLESGGASVLPFGYLKSYMLNSSLTPFITGSAQPQITIENLKSFKVLVPNKAVIDAFEFFSLSIEDKIEGNKRVANTLANLRDTLLPRLISGQLRLPEAEKQAIEALA